LWSAVESAINQASQYEPDWMLVWPVMTTVVVFEPGAAPNARVAVPMFAIAQPTSLKGSLR
jgi:hypothetical protein